MIYKALFLSYLFFVFAIQACSASDASLDTHNKPNCWAASHNDQKKIDKLLSLYGRDAFFISYKPKSSVDRSLTGVPIECVKIEISQERQVEVLSSDNPILNRYAILKSQKLLKEEPKAKGIAIFYFLNSRLEASGFGKLLSSE